MSIVRSQDGTAIVYDRLGSGPPLILVDGALCSRAFGPMPKLALSLAQHFTVFTYDRRGRGDSADTKPYARQREVEDLDALIQLAGRPACVLGFSSGAALALEAAASGLNIAKLAVYEPPYMVAPEHAQHHGSANHEAQLNWLIAAGRRGAAVRYFMRKVVNVPAPFVLLAQLLPVWPKLKAVAHTLPYDTAVMGDFSLPTRRLAAVMTPTLVLGGDKSDTRLLASVQAVAKQLLNGRLQILKDQTHNVKVEVLSPVLLEFFAA